MSVCLQHVNRCLRWQHGKQMSSMAPCLDVCLSTTGKQMSSMAPHLDDTTGKQMSSVCLSVCLQQVN